MNNTKHQKREPYEMRPAATRGACRYVYGMVYQQTLMLAHLLGVYTVRSSDRPVGPTQATSDCLSDQSDRPVGQTSRTAHMMSIKSMWPVSWL